MRGPGLVLVQGPSTNIMDHVNHTILYVSVRKQWRCHFYKYRAINQCYICDGKGRKTAGMKLMSSLLGPDVRD